MKNARVLFFLSVLVSFCTTSFFVVKAEVIFASDIETLLKHSQLELHNPLLFDAGVSDLALVFHHGQYRKNPQLEKEFIVLVRYAQTHAQNSSLLIEPLFQEVYSFYKKTRYGLELALLASKGMSHNTSEDDSCAKGHDAKLDKKLATSKNNQLKSKEQNEADLSVALFSVVSARRARTKKASVKKAAAKKVSVKKPRLKRLTKKEKAAQELLIAPKMAEFFESSISDEIAPVRKKRVSKKKESMNVEGQSVEASVKKRASRKKVEPSIDNSGEPLVLPKKRASRKKAE